MTGRDGRHFFMPKNAANGNIATLFKSCITVWLGVF